MPSPEAELIQSLPDNLPGVPRSRGTDRKLVDLVQSLPDGPVPPSALTRSGPARTYTGGALQWLGKKTGVSQLGWLGQGVDEAQKKYLQPAEELFHRFGEFVNQPLVQTQNVPVNVASGIPGALLGMGSEFEGKMVGSLIDQGVLGAAGAGAKAAGVFPWLARGVRAVDRGIASAIPVDRFPSWFPTSFLYRGGQTSASKVAGEALDAAKAVGIQQTGDLVNRMESFAPLERNLVRELAQQPAIRDAMRNENAKAIDLWTWKYHQREVPGQLGDYFAAEGPSTVPVSRPMKEFVEAADAMAKEFGANRNDMVRLAIKDPAYFARFNEMNYFPYRFAGEKMELMPGIGAAAERERSSFLAMRGSKDVAERLTSDPTASLTQAMLQQKRLIATREYFGRLALDPNVVKSIPEGLDLPAGQSFRWGSQWYTRMVDDQALGPLAGKFVRSAEAKDINALTQQTNMLSQVVNEWMSLWRFSKIIPNPLSYVRNYGTALWQNATAGLMPGRVDIYDRVGADLVKNGEWSKVLRAAQAPWMIDRESTRLADLITEAGLKHDVGDDMVLRWLTAVPRFLKTNSASAAVARVYQANDKLFKSSLAYYKVHEEGMPIDQAVELADKLHVNYSRQPLWVRQVRSSTFGIPFITFDYGQVPNMARTAIEHPNTFLRAKLAMDTWNDVSADQAKISKDERESMERLYQGKLMMILPWRSAHGGAQVIDLTPFNPYSATMNTVRSMPSGVAGRVPGIFQNEILRNPILGELMAQVTGVDPQLGRAFAPPMGQQASLMDAASRLGLNNPKMEQIAQPLSRGPMDIDWSHAARTALPSLLGGSSFQRLRDAAQGKANFMGVKTSVPSALLQALLTGPVRDVNSDKALMAMRFANLMNTAQSQRVRQARDRAR